MESKILWRVNRKIKFPTKMIAVQLSSSRADVSRKFLSPLLMTPQCCGCLGHHPRKAPLLTQRRSRAWLMFGRDKFETRLQQSHGWTCCWDCCCWAVLLFLAQETLNWSWTKNIMLSLWIIMWKKINQLCEGDRQFSKHCPTAHIQNGLRPFWIFEKVWFKNLVQAQNKC